MPEFGFVLIAVGASQSSEYGLPCSSVGPRTPPDNDAWLLPNTPGPNIGPPFVLGVIGLPVASNFGPQSLLPHDPRLFAAVGESPVVPIIPELDRILGAL